MLKKTNFVLTGGLLYGNPQQTLVLFCNEGFIKVHQPSLWECQLYLTFSSTPSKKTGMELWLCPARVMEIASDDLWWETASSLLYLTPEFVKSEWPGRRSGPLTLGIFIHPTLTGHLYFILTFQFPVVHISGHIGVGHTGICIPLNSKSRTK